MDMTAPQFYKKREGWYYIPHAAWNGKPFGPFPTREAAKKHSKGE